MNVENPPKKIKKKDQIVIDVQNLLKHYTNPVTLRQLYYRVVAKYAGNGYFENTMNNYKALSRYLVEARRNGLINERMMADKTRTANVPNYEVYWNTEERMQLYITSEVKELVRAGSHYSEPRWSDQPYRIVIVLEKMALQSVIEPICKNLDIALITCKGYNSYSQLKQLADNLIGRQEDDNRKVIFLTFGDFDASGFDIMRNFEKQLRDMNVEGDFIPKALTKEQIETYELPHAPAKKTDSRSEKFIAEHGDFAVELDALDPQVLADLVETSVNEYFDRDIYKAVRERYMKKRKWLKLAMAKVVEDFKPDFERIFGEIESWDEIELEN